MLSVAASLLTLAMKFTAYYATGSVGLLSDALESLVNLAAALVATTLLIYASRPADDTHAYGHDKAEYFASGVEGTLIILAAAGIVYSATDRLLHPQPLGNLTFGLTVALAASGVNLIVARVLLAAAGKHDSITLEADARHLMTDVLSSVVVVAGLVIVAVTGFNMLDPLLAFLVAGNIVLQGIDLLRRSFRGLMDYSLPREEIETIKKILQKHAGTIRHHHNLRTRKSGPTRFIDLHILVTGDMTVQASHDLCDLVEQEIERKLKRTQVTIHVEPIEDRSSWDAVSGIRNKTSER